MTRSCSWCHAENPDTEIDCRKCGHMAHVPRTLCTCPTCSPTMGRQRAELARDFEMPCPDHGHTPGPWFVHDRSGVWPDAHRAIQARFTDSHGDRCEVHVARVDELHSTAEARDRAAANARLIALAPEMFDLLREIKDDAEDCFVDPEELSDEWKEFNRRVAAVIARVAGANP